MMKHSWKAYSDFAWGYDELRPLSRTGFNWIGANGLAMTIVDSLDTLHIMGLNDEFDRAKKYTLTTLSFDVNQDVSVFETTIRVLGGLISAYNLDSDIQFLDLALELANRMLPAFNTPTGFPRAKVNLQSGKGSGSSFNSLADVGTLILEWGYLSDASGNPIYREKADFIVRALRNLSSSSDVPGLYPEGVNVEKLEFASRKFVC